MQHGSQPKPSTSCRQQTKTRLHSLPCRSHAATGSNNAGRSALLRFHNCTCYIYYLWILCLSTHVHAVPLFHFGTIYTILLRLYCIISRACSKHPVA
jgi:hypothetical protein